MRRERTGREPGKTAVVQVPVRRGALLRGATAPGRRALHGALLRAEPARYRQVRAGLRELHTGSPVEVSQPEVLLAQEPEYSSVVVEPAELPALWVSLELAKPVSGSPCVASSARVSSSAGAFASSEPRLTASPECSTW